MLQRTIPKQHSTVYLSILSACNDPICGPDALHKSTVCVPCMAHTAEQFSPHVNASPPYLHCVTLNTRVWAIAF
eukprot:gene13222-biopygen16541